LIPQFDFGTRAADPFPPGPFLPPEILTPSPALALIRFSHAPGAVFTHNHLMILSRLVGGCLAAFSFILLGLVMSSRGSATVGIEVMDRLGLVFVLSFLGAQLVVCLVFLKPGDLLVPVLLFAGGAILYAVVTGTGSGPDAVSRIPLHQALFAGASFSGLASGVLLMIEVGSGREDD
jgi:hypothetical protein